MYPIMEGECTPASNYYYLHVKWWELAKVYGGDRKANKNLWRRIKNNPGATLNAVSQDKSIKRFCCPTTSLVAESKIR